MNWPSLIHELIERGLTQEQIALRCGVSQSHISFLYRGKRKEPGWSLGDSLIRLHKKVRKNNAKTA